MVRGAGCRGVGGVSGCCTQPSDRLAAGAAGAAGAVYSACWRSGSWAGNRDAETGACCAGTRWGAIRGQVTTGSCQGVCTGARNGACNSACTGARGGAGIGQSTGPSVGASIGASTSASTEAVGGAFMACSNRCTRSACTAACCGAGGKTNPSGPGCAAAPAAAGAPATAARPPGAPLPVTGPASAGCMPVAVDVVMAGVMQAPARARRAGDCRQFPRFPPLRRARRRRAVRA